MRVLGSAGIAEMKKKIREMLILTEDEEKKLAEEGVELIITTPYFRRIDKERNKRLEKIRERMNRILGK